MVEDRFELSRHGRFTFVNILQLFILVVFVTIAVFSVGTVVLVLFALFHPTLIGHGIGDFFGAIKQGFDAR